MGTNTKGRERACRSRKPAENTGRGRLFLGAILILALAGCDLQGGTGGGGNNGGGGDDSPTVDLQEQKVTASDAAEDDQFGDNVAIDGDTAIVGAPLHDEGATSDAGAAYVFTRSGGEWTQVATLTASDAAANDTFGASVAISGATAIVGARGDDGKGAAYIFRPAGGWVGSLEEDAKLTATDRNNGDDFGLSVSISGDTAIVGDPGHREGSEGFGPPRGAAYIFAKPGTGWEDATDVRLTASDAADEDDFGESVSISGDTAIVGASGDDDPGANSGAAYVFTKEPDGWTNANNEDAKLTASDADGGDSFGGSVSISGDTAIVGAVADNDVGSAYVFIEPTGGWTNATNEDAKLTASDAEAGDRFGDSVAIDGDTALVGANEDDVGGTSDTGSAYVFIAPGGGWVNTNEDAKLTASNAALGDDVGWSVAIIDGDTALVGAPFDDVGGTSDTGSAYFFQL